MTGMTGEPDRTTGGLATAVGAASFVSVASLALFFAVGGPFGTINDWTIGLVGILTALLALAFWRDRDVARSPIGIVATAVAVVGSVIVVLGSVLVISRTTGFFLAGLVESLGFSLVGAWLVWLNRSTASAQRWPGRLTMLGILAGVLMAIGVVVLPGIVAGLDNMDAAPPWIWIGFVGWLGIFFIYPAWCLWLGATLRSVR